MPQEQQNILKTLKDFGRLPTTRIAYIVNIFPLKCKSILEELYKNKKIKKIEETNATYWEIKK